jgi:hypothetical protein
MTRTMATNGGLDARRWQQRTDRDLGPDTLFSDASLVTRADILQLASRLNWPTCSYNKGRVVLDSESAWKESAMPYRTDRRELWEQLTAIASRRQRPAVDSEEDERRQ